MMMNKVFKEEKKEKMEVDMDDKIFQYSEEGLHSQHLAIVFQRSRPYNMRLIIGK